MLGISRHCSGGELFSRWVAPQLSLPLPRFTSVFGMGTGGTRALRPPEKCFESRFQLPAQPMCVPTEPDSLIFPKKNQQLTVNHNFKVKGHDQPCFL